MKGGKPVKGQYDCRTCDAGTRLMRGCTRREHLDFWDTSRLEKGLARHERQGTLPAPTCPVPVLSEPEVHRWLTLHEMTELGLIQASGVKMRYRDWRAVSLLTGEIKRLELEMANSGNDNKRDQNGLNGR